MAYKRLKPGEKRAKRAGKKRPYFETAPEFERLKRDLVRGLEPRAGIQILLNDADLKRLKITVPRTVTRFLQTYIKNSGYHYHVRGFNAPEGYYCIIENLEEPRKATKSA